MASPLGPAPPTARLAPAARLGPSASACSLSSLDIDTHPSRPPLPLLITLLSLHRYTARCSLQAMSASAATPADATKPARDRLEPSVIKLIVILLTGAIPALLDTSIVNVAVDTIGRD